MQLVLEGYKLRAKANILSCLQNVKVKVLEQVQDQLNDILDKALTESVQPFTQLQPTVNGKTNKKPSSR